MSVLRNILLLALAFVLQTTWIQALELAAIKPDLILVVLIHVALRGGSTQGALLGFGVGFLQDIYMPADLGLNALLMGLTGFGVGYCRSGIVADDVKVQLALIFGTVLVYSLVFYLGSSGVAWMDVPYFWIRYSIGRAAYSSLVGALVFAALLLRSHFTPA